LRSTALSIAEADFKFRHNVERWRKPDKQRVLSQQAQANGMNGPAIGKGQSLRLMY
jgi:hypothetical protein